jgi:hypothetical protein
VSSPILKLELTPLPTVWNRVTLFGVVGSSPGRRRFKTGRGTGAAKGHWSHNNRNYQISDVEISHVIKVVYTASP